MSKAGSSTWSSRASNASHPIKSSSFRLPQGQGAQQAINAIKTMANIQKVQDKVRSTGGFGSISDWSHSKERPKVIATAGKDLEYSFYTCNKGIRISANNNEQAANADLAFFSASDLGAMMTQVGGGAAQNVYFDSVHGDTMMTNQGSDVIRVYVYDVIAKRDLASAVTSPLGAWSSSYTDMGLVSNDKWKVIGTSPFSNQLFREYFTVKNTTHLQLGPGQTHIHKIRYKPRQFLNAEVQAKTLLGYKDFTAWTFIVAMGMPTNGGNDSDKVGTGKVALDVVRFMEYKYTYLSNHIPKVIQSDTLEIDGTQRDMEIDGDPQNYQQG